MPTALELSRQEWQKYVEAARRRPPLPEPSMLETALRKERLERVHQVAKHLKQQFKVANVILFGSLTDRTQFSPNSDVDLAVVGLRPKDYFEAWRVAEELLQDCVVDLVEMELVTDSLRQAILKYGVEI